jgi:phage terminase Nu1 subunit (DNA packaging protein)
MTEPQKSQRWRKARNLNVEQLAALSGYSIEAVYAFERGVSTARGGGKIKPWAWQRWKNCCAGIDAEIVSGRKFGWET